LSSGFVLSLGTCSKFLDSEFRFFFSVVQHLMIFRIQIFQSSSTSDDRKGDGNIGEPNKMGT